MKFNDALAKDIEGKPEFNFLKDAIGKEITMSDVRLYMNTLCELNNTPKHIMWRILATHYLSNIPKYKVYDAYNSELIGYAKNIQQAKRIAREYEEYECDGEEVFVAYKTYNKTTCKWEKPEMI